MEDMKLLPLLLLAGFVVAWLAAALPVHLKARRARGAPVTDLAPDLQRRIAEHPRLLIYCWSPTCGMCRRMTPLIDRIAAGRDDVVKLDLHAHRRFAPRLGVAGVPALVLIERGRITRVLLGARSERQVRALIG